LRNLVDQYKEPVGAILSFPIENISSIRSGGNSNSFQVKCVNGEQYFLKQYPSSNTDLRDRQGVEKSALQLIEQNLKGLTPHYIGGDYEEKIAVFEWIEGEPVSNPSESDITAMVAFVSNLKKISQGIDASAFVPASEACLSGVEISRQIEARIETLLVSEWQDIDLLQILDQELQPIFEEVKSWVQKNIGLAETVFDQKLNQSDQILSPSDFGFHNTLRRSDGSLVFVDFEYFGWDDPVKLMADFLLHPGHELDSQQKRSFVQKTQRIFGDSPLFLARLNLFKPLYELRWCLIILNPFNAEYRIGRAMELTSQLKDQCVTEVRRRLTNLPKWYKNLDYGK
jgi:thiamine kinase-like enzyme